MSTRVAEWRDPRKAGVTEKIDISGYNQQRRDVRLRTIDLQSDAKIYGAKYSSQFFKELAGCGFISGQRRAGLLEEFGTSGTGGGWSPSHAGEGDRREGGARA